MYNPHRNEFQPSALFRKSTVERRKLYSDSIDIDCYLFLTRINTFLQSKKVFDSSVLSRKNHIQSNAILSDTHYIVVFIEKGALNFVG